ncbi:MAG: hypothetical protein DHS20C18_01450 [Saprospiraceae bacterium]|nr:MAG: hypothetical protein DHS20C18_01450 [Saprospiraceae bacterium]
MKVLICEDEEVLMTALELRLRKGGFEVEIIAAENSIAEYILRVAPALVIISLGTLKESAADLLINVQKNQKHPVPFIVIGDTDQGEILLSLLKKGASDFMIKPFKTAELVLRIRKVLDN